MSHLYIVYISHGVSILNLYHEDTSIISEFKDICVPLEVHKFKCIKLQVFTLLIKVFQE